MKLTTDIEDQVDAIRDEIYEEIKDMSPSDETAYFNAKAKEAECFRITCPLRRG